ncbi:maltotransferase domain-containing protein, partial [Streptomyces sp. NPDC053367]|uniref:maltotransferase domain-containing protein n=1 Tax=Streptomyces sp. NPDC053367 TaxID=3365700 RepID=UPI0037CE23BE
MPATHQTSAVPTPSTEQTPERRAPRAKTPTKRTPAKTAAKTPATTTPAKTAAKSAAKAPAETAAKSPAKAPAKTAAKKTTKKAAARTPVKAPVKAKAKPAPAVGRIPVLDVQPVVQHGRRPAKAVTGETFEVSATVFREGHDAVSANVVLTGPDGKSGPFTPMRELAPGTDRWGATVSADRPGLWTFTVEAWSDPITTWRHHARIKVPAGIDTGLVLEEGARLHERAAVDTPKTDGMRDTLLAVAEALRDENRPATVRLAAALLPEVDEVLARYPLRELVTASEPMPLLVERERALYGSWYEFFPRSEGTPHQPHGTFRTAARRLPA